MRGGKHSKKKKKKKKNTHTPPVFKSSARVPVRKPRAGQNDRNKKTDKEKPSLSNGGPNFENVTSHGGGKKQEGETVNPCFDTLKTKS